MRVLLGVGRRQTGRLPEVAEHCAELGRLSTRQHALGSRLHGEGEREREREGRERGESLYVGCAYRRCGSDSRKRSAKKVADRRKDVP